MNGIQLERMEAIEAQYGIHLHVDQYPDHDEYYQLFPSVLASQGTKKFLGNTLDEVETKLAD